MDTLGTFAGIKIVQSIHLTIPYEDWSGVRSPSRAIRRQKRGFRQNIRHLRVPDPKVIMIHGVAHMHHATFAAFNEVLRNREPTP